MTTLDTTLIPPWRTDTPDLLTRSLTHLVAATVVTADGERITLDVGEGRVSFDETRSPRVTAQLGTRVLTDQALLSRIDPRTGCRVEIDAGYRRPDGTDDVHPLADLAMRSRAVQRPADTMTVEAAGDESLLIDAGITAGGLVSGTSTVSAIENVIQQVMPTVTVTTNMAGTPGVTALVFEDRWDAVADLADGIEAQVYADETRQWWVRSVPALATPAHEMRVGAAGTIISSDAGLSRDDGWANYVWLQYKWTPSGGSELQMNSTRYISSGDYATSTAGLRIIKVEREVSATQARADSACASLLKRMVTRGRTFEVEGIAAYWLRPGHTIEVKLPIGDDERHVVTAVEFDLRAGTMRVSTRLPDNTGTIA